MCAWASGSGVNGRVGWPLEVISRRTSAAATSLARRRLAMRDAVMLPVTVDPRTGINGRDSYAEL